MAKTMAELIEILTAEDDVKKKKDQKRKKLSTKKKIMEKEDVLISYPKIYYMGYVNRYNVKPIAVSDNKELLKEYMENHRYIKRGEYYIEKVNNLSEHDVFVMYHDQFLVEYEGYYLPSIDTTMIDFYKRSMQAEIYNTIKSLGKIDLLVKEIDLVSDDERDSLYQAMKTLTHFIRDKEIMEEIEHEDTITNSIIFEDINTYLKDLSCFNEMMDMHRRYEYQLYKDDFVMINCANK